MKKVILLAGFFCLALSISRLHAQSINNRDWKTYIADAVNDTITLHVRSDSSYVTNNRGDVIVHTSIKFDGDTITITDTGSGEHECPGQIGKYKVTISANTCTFTLISDACEGRGQALNGIKWTEIQYRR